MSKRTLTSFTKVGAVVVALAAVSTARAQEGEQAQPAPAPESQTQESQPQGSQAQETKEMPPAATPQSELPPCPMPPPPAPPPMAAAPPPTEHHHNIVFAPEQVSIVTGAGPTNYFGSGLSASRTDTGALWDARATFGAHSIFAVEAGYVGSVNNVDSSNGVQGQLYSNGLDGDLRLQLPTKVQPYIFGGVGYNHMAVNRQGSPDISAQFTKTSDDQLTVPAGGGVSGYAGKHVTVDLRGTYRLMPDNNITIMNAHALHQWYAQARLGYTF
jgi:opacity protein-like surface antigen